MQKIGRLFFIGALGPLLYLVYTHFWISTTVLWMGLGLADVVTPTGWSQLPRYMASIFINMIVWSHVSRWVVSALDYVLPGGRTPQEGHDGRERA